MARYLITGGSGFIGSNLIRKLIKENQELTILIRENSDLWRINDLVPKIKTIKTDFSNYEKLEKLISDIDPNFVYHLGTYGGYPFQTSIQKTTQVNIINTIKLFESLSKCNNLKLVINFGSSSEYGPKSNPMNENDDAIPTTPYGISKLTQTNFAKFYSENVNLPIVTLRLFSVFGPFEEPGRLIFDIITSIIKGKTIELSSPFPRRDFVYVSDVIEAIETVTNAKNIVGDIFNIGSGVMHSVEDVVNNALKIAKSDNKISWDVKQKRVFDDMTPWVSDIQKIKKNLKWEPKYSFADGLALTYKWYLNNQQIWDKDDV